MISDFQNDNIIVTALGNMLWDFTNDPANFTDETEAIQEREEEEQREWENEQEDKYLEDLSEEGL